MEDNNKKLVIEGLENLLSYGKNAPKELDTFVEVAEAIKELKPLSYHSIKKLKDYLYEVVFTSLDEKYASDYFESQKALYYGACSSIRKGNWFGRNFDWLYDNNAEFLVRIPHMLDQKGIIGVAASIPGLTQDFVDSGENSDLYKLLPFKLEDGINEDGLIASMNVVPVGETPNLEVIPEEEALVRLSGVSVVSYVLRHFSNAIDAVNFIKKHMNIFLPKSLLDVNYELHYTIVDKDNSFVLEVIDGAINILEDQKIMTNFMISGTTPEADGKYLTPATCGEGQTVGAATGIAPHGAGLERYNILVDKYDSIIDKDSMRDAMNAVNYSIAYEEDANWHTEFVGVNNLTIDSSLEDYLIVENAIREMLNDVDRNSELGKWQTVHSSVYDIANKTLYLINQEDIEADEIVCECDIDLRAEINRLKVLLENNE